MSATDYDGNGITNSTGPLSSSAQFSSETQLFSWTPNYSQTGIYTIVFYAHDNDPLDPKTGQMEVVIPVGDVSAIDLANRLINTVLALRLSKDVENSYMANLKNVPIYLFR